MSARLSGAPWLLIEMGAWSLVTDASAGCSAGSARTNWPLNDWRCAWRLERLPHHWICAVDGDGRTLVSVKVPNVEAAIVAALATVTDLADRVVWAVDIVGAPSALILALLVRAGGTVFYASGRVVNTMSTAFIDEGKTDAEDA